jgi:hypothetical protein
MTRKPAPRRSNRTTIRGVLILVIVATIPLYLCGIGLWFLSRDEATAIDPIATATEAPVSGATRTPIDTNVLLTEFALTTSPTPLPSPTETIPVFQTFEPIVITNTSAPVFLSPTMIPTRFVTSTPTVPPTATTVPPTLPATNTPPPALPTATEPILAPPTDTPTP